MKQDKTLLIMAAGIGSRFGGLKQLEPVGPTGEFIIDYSIYDAIQTGFTKVVFVIKKENEQTFKETIGNRIANHIKVEYAYQTLDDIPKGYTLPNDREKPWGTAHAVYAARNLIHEPFAVINADDFYGRDAYTVISNFLDHNPKQKYCIIGYIVKNTLSENGAVKRAVIYQNDDKLDRLVESSIERKNGTITAIPLDNGDSFEVDENCLVCMNMLGFTEDLFTYIEEKFKLFLDKNKDSKTSEFFIPTIIEAAGKENVAEVKIIPTTAKWEGITYKEDKKLVVNEIIEKINNGEYPKELWK